MKKTTVIVILTILTTTGNAQLIDSLGYLIRQKYSIDVRLESRASFIGHELTSISGVRLGLTFKRKLRLGGGISWLKTDGYSWLKTNVTRGFTVTHDDGSESVERRYLKFVYACYYIDFVFYKTKHWQLSVPIQAGTGSIWFQKNKAYTLGAREQKYFLFLYEPGITLQYKIFKWLGAGADVTYRFALQNKKKTEVQLSSLSLTFKALFWFDYLFYELYPKHELTKRYGPAYW